VRRPEEENVTPAFTFLNPLVFYEIALAAACDRPR
jgi:hypothetical protein